MAARCYSAAQGRSAGSTDREQEIAEAERLARRAAELGRDDAVALCAAGSALAVVVGDLDDGAALIDRALALNPNLAWAWHFSALAKAFLGEPETAIEHAARAMRMFPQDPQIAMQCRHGTRALLRGRNAEALSWAEIAVLDKPNHLIGVCLLTASRGLGGELRGSAVRAWRGCRSSIRRCALPI